MGHEKPKKVYLQIQKNSFIAESYLELINKMSPIKSDKSLNGSKNTSI